MICREIRRNTVTLVSKVRYVFEDFAIWKSTEISRAAAVIQLLEGKIGFGAFGSITVNMDSPNWIFASWFIVSQLQYLAGKGDGAVSINKGRG